MSASASSLSGTIKNRNTDVSSSLSSSSSSSFTGMRPAPSVKLITPYVHGKVSTSFSVGLFLGLFLRSMQALFARRSSALQRKARGFCEPPLEVTISDKFGESRKIRRLREDDFERGFLLLLQQLTVCPKMSKEKYLRRFRQLKNGPEYVYVMTNEAGTKIVGSATLLVERKFARNRGCVAHVEDVVVDERERRTGLGKTLIDGMSVIARNYVGCYKSILDCAAENVKFYEKVGFSPKEIQMAKYYSGDRGYGNNYTTTDANDASSKNNVVARRDREVLVSGDERKKNGNPGIMKINDNNAGDRQKGQRQQRKLSYAAGTDEGFAPSSVPNSPEKTTTPSLNQTMYYSDEEL